MVDFIAQLRELSGGKPVGFKLCVGNPIEFCAVVRAMVDKKIYPDFITSQSSPRPKRKNKKIKKTDVLTSFPSFSELQVDGGEV